MEVSRAVSDPAEIERLQGEGAEVASFLKTSIMQLERQEGAEGKETYGLELSGEHDGGLVEPIVPGMELPK